MPKEKQENYKDRCDEVLLKRGKNGGTVVPRGLTTKQVFDFLKETKDNEPKYKDRKSVV